MIKRLTVMGMPSTINVVDPNANETDIDQVFKYFQEMDRIFSTYKPDSDIEKIKRGQLKEADYPSVVKEVLSLAEATKKETGGYFDIYPEGNLDPSGLVKGYAIHRGAEILKELGYKNFLVEIAGDIEVFGKNSDGRDWSVGIENPFTRYEIIKIVNLSGKGIATSGTYLRGDHIYNPLTGKKADEIMSLTVIGPNIYEADRFATAAFAMGEIGLSFIDSLPGFDGYMVGKNKVARQTSGLRKYVGN